METDNRESDDAEKGRRQSLGPMAMFKPVAFPDEQGGMDQMKFLCGWEDGYWKTEAGMLAGGLGFGKSTRGVRYRTAVRRPLQHGQA